MSLIVTQSKCSLSNTKLESLGERRNVRRGVVGCSGSSLVRRDMTLNVGSERIALR